MESLALALVLGSGAAIGVATPAAGSARPVIETSDVDRFYAIYDAAGGQPTAAVLQHEYLDPGSEGLHVLARMRRVTGQSIADAIAKRPEIYVQARECIKTLPRVRERLAAAMGRLAQLYPDARFPPVTIAIGRGKPIGIGGRDTGVQIGAEALCANAWINPDIGDRFVRVVMHEYAHVQQAVSFSERDGATVLAASLEEGAAEFVTELTTGATAYAYLDALVAGRETDIETAFAADKDKTDLSDWLYNSTPQAPADLGYWVGYRIVKFFYQRNDDKQEAIRVIFEMTDPADFLEKSGWRPGIELD
jgi:hypothetical protein